MKTTNERFKDNYTNEALTLQQSNIELKKKINDYKYERKDNWVYLKWKFDNDIESIRNEIADLFTEIIKR